MNAKLLTTYFPLPHSKSSFAHKRRYFLRAFSIASLIGLQCMILITGMDFPYKKLVWAILLVACLGAIVHCSLAKYWIYSDALKIVNKMGTCFSSRPSNVSFTYSCNLNAGTPKPIFHWLRKTLCFGIVGAFLVYTVVVLPTLYSIFRTLFIAEKWPLAFISFNVAVMTSAYLAMLYVSRLPGRYIQRKIDNSEFDRAIKIILLAEHWGFDRFLQDRAVVLLQCGKFADAEKILRQELLLNPVCQNYELLQLYGTALLEMGHLSPAEKVFKACAELAPTMPNAMIFQARILLEQQKSASDAIDLLNDALRQCTSKLRISEETTKDVFAGLACASAACGRRLEAERYFQQFLCASRTPLSAEKTKIKCVEAEYEFYLGHLDEAERMVKQILPTLTGGPVNLRMKRLRDRIEQRLHRLKFDEPASDTLVA